MTYWTTFHGTHEELEDWLSGFPDPKGVFLEESEPGCWAVCLLTTPRKEESTHEQEEARSEL